MIYTIIAFLSAVCSVSQSAFTKLSKDNNVITFNVVKVGAGLVLFLVPIINGFVCHLPTFVYGSLYGLSLLFSMTFGYLALMKGPMSLTSLICSYSVVIPCVFGMLLWNETLSVLQSIGLLILFISIFLLRKKDNKIEFKKNWALCVVITFITNGICSVIQKSHQLSFPGLFRNEFMLCAYLIIFFVFVVLQILKKESINKRNIKYPSLAGAMMGISNYLTLILSSYMNATVVFPIITGLTMVLNYAVSRFLFKEKLSGVQIVGLIFGIAALVLLKL